MDDPTRTAERLIEQSIERLIEQSSLGHDACYARCEICRDEVAVDPFDDGRCVMGHRLDGAGPVHQVDWPLTHTQWDDLSAQPCYDHRFVPCEDASAVCTKCGDTNIDWVRDV
jgi:hypothetical protein